MKVETKNAVLIGLMSCTAYSACYTGRNILSAAMPQLAENKVFTQSSLGSMASALLLFYGLGQLINGFIGNRISAKYMVTAGLGIAGILTILFAYTTNSVFGIGIWAVVGFFCSMLWGPLSKLIGENTEKSAGRMLLTCLTGASIVGILLTYLLALAGTSVKNAKLPFISSGILLVIIAAAFYVLTASATRRGIIKNYDITLAKNNKTNSKKLFLNIGFISMLLVCSLNGIIRNAVVFWVPTFISQNFSVSSAVTMAISTLMPITNLIGSFLSMWLYKIIGRDERKLCIYLFLFSVFMFVTVYLCGKNLAWLSISALFMACAAMTGVCNMVFSIYVLHFSNTGLISGITGFFDFTSYITASAASSLFPKLLNVGGWNAVVVTWIAATVSGLAFAVLAFKKDTAFLIDRV